MSDIVRIAMLYFGWPVGFNAAKSLQRIPCLSSTIKSHANMIQLQNYANRTIEPCFDISLQRKGNISR
jgi:hypothetical protein